MKGFMKSTYAPQVGYGRRIPHVRRVTPRIDGRITAKQSAVSKKTAATGTKSSGSYLNVTGFPFPLGPLTQRQTIRREIEKGVMWVFEQPQSLGFSNVTTNVRMVVIKLKSGGLWVHAPIAPTKECLALLKELDAPVEYIILPTFAYEHKIFVGPFARRFPKAKVYVAPKQWSWPINLPVQLFGIFPTGVLKNDDTETPWADEIEQKVLISSVGIGPYIEVAFFHKKTKTLLVTDAVISVPSQPPSLVEEANLIDAAKSNFFVKVLAGDKALEPVNGVPLQPDTLTPAVRDLGWKRMALQILYIVPGDLRDPTKGFAAISNRLIVGPILKTLVFSTEPELSKEWIDDICSSWKFTQIVPAHFTAPIKAGPKDLRKAFSFLDGNKSNTGSIFDKLFSSEFSYPDEDIKALDAAKQFLVNIGAVKK
ncbi:hypothetical protein PSENEW3_00001396 [Picochlorum sp. SENEW3]|nr:hypothetical protein PSENEW3_00001396 [Picochlorum sp. SENEW3]